MSGRRQAGRDRWDRGSWTDGGKTHFKQVWDMWQKGTSFVNAMINIVNSTIRYDTISQVRLAKAMGNTVTAISTSPHKETAARWPKQFYCVFSI